MTINTINTTEEPTISTCLSPDELIKLFTQAVKATLIANNSLLLDAGDAAKIVGVGRTLWYQLNSEAKIPAPIQLSKRVLWRRSELLKWADAGCPIRAEWEFKILNS